MEHASAPTDPSPEGAAHPGPGQQPFLHDRDVLVLGPALVVSGCGGNLADEPDGFYLADRRVLHRLDLRVAGAEMVPIERHRHGPCTAVFRSVVRDVGQHGPDPALTVTVERFVQPDAFRDLIVVANDGRADVAVELRLAAAVDGATMPEVKSGLTRVSPRPPVPAEATPGGLRWRAPGGVEVDLLASPPPEGTDAGGGHLRWRVEVPAGQRWEAEVWCRVRQAPDPLFAAAPPDARPWSPPEVEGDRRLHRLLDTALGDLAAMLLQDAASGSALPDVFVAAGAPWFMTLFGRDSLWAARMLLPLSTGLAAGTLRVLGRRQGTRSDPVREEQPGKILHELRPEGTLGQGNLPATYFGTIDATPLWVTLLRDAWRWGMPVEQVEPLLANAEAALAWMADHGDPDGDGLLEYAAGDGAGLANQGWRDSADSIRWHDGRLADPPIALAEVQAYAYEAAVAGAELLEGFGRPGADRWRSWAAALRRRFHARFWIETAGGPLPAVALDGQGRPVDSATSALGHLLGTGLLDDEQAAVVAARLGRDDLHAGYGLRTLSRDAVGFNPLGYHTGSIWPHDTLIAAAGLQREGFAAAAWSLIDGLLDAAAAFDYRLPELFAGHGRGAGPPSPYPAACRPQAWAAAAAGLAVRTLLGLEPDVPAGLLRVAPLPQLGAGFAVRGLSVMGGPLGVTVTPDGPVVAAPGGLTVVEGV